MIDTSADATRLSPWWRHSAILVMIAGFSVLSLVTVLTYTNAPPIPEQATDGTGTVVFTGADIQMGQEVFLKYGLMEHGSLWGHGAYLGPDYSAEYLHRLSEVQKWSIYCLMAVGVWNFVGAGIFGSLINLPIVSYFEVGTTLTPNHGHAALFGVFGMLV